MALCTTLAQEVRWGDVTERRISSCGMDHWPGTDLTLCIPKTKYFTFSRKQHPREQLSVCRKWVKYLIKDRQCSGKGTILDETMIDRNWWSHWNQRIVSFSDWSDRPQGLSLPWQLDFQWNSVFTSIWSCWYGPYCLNWYIVLLHILAFSGGLSPYLTHCYHHYFVQMDLGLSH